MTELLQHTLARVLCVLVLVIVGSIIIFSNHIDKPGQYLYPVFEFGNWNHLATTRTAKVAEDRCGPPKIPVWHQSAKRFHRKVILNCRNGLHKELSGQPAFSIRQGHWLQGHQKLNSLGLSCCYRPFFGVDTGQNLTIRYSESCHNITLPKTEIPSDIDFIEVVCPDKKNSIVYRDAYFLAQLKNSTELPSSLSDSPLNVVIVGLDATSRLNFKRVMPRASDFLLQQLGAVDLEEYSVVATGTKKNSLPLLTGKSWGEVAKECEQGIDACRSLFLWHNFGKLGYITSMSEDDSTWSLESPLVRAFNDSLTYYNRPFEFYMGKQKWGSCVGPRLSLQSFLEFVESVSQVARGEKKPHFQFIWAGMAHDSHNQLAVGEPSLLQFLLNFKNSSAQNDTVLVVLADHGQGSDMRFWGTPEGRQEYNLPLAYVVLPPWFPKTYPGKFANLKDNARRVVTPYDMHETFQEIAELSSKDRPHKGLNKTRRGTSLFDKIVQKKCIDAGISLRFCRKCYPEIQVNSSDPLVKFAANAILSEVNGQVKGFENNCTNQTLKETKAGTKWDPRDVSRELCNIFGYSDQGRNNNHLQTRLFNISCKVEAEMVDLVDVEVVTNPKGARYQGQVMVKRNRNDGQILNTKILNTHPYRFTDGVQRIDRYKHTGKCVSKDLQPFCICK